MVWVIYIILAFLTAAIIMYLVIKDHVPGREIRISDLDFIDEEWALVVFGAAFWPVTLIVIFFAYVIKYIFYVFFVGIIKGINKIKNFNEKQSKSKLWKNILK